MPKVEIPKQDPDWEPTVTELLKEVYDVVTEINARLAGMEVRQKGMEERQKVIKSDIDEAPEAPLQGGFGATDFGAPPTKK
jgi:hypothetical protein